MALGWASDTEYQIPIEILEQRLSKIKGEMRYYTPQIHQASFALPQYMLNKQ
jgi:spermidine synthase